MRLKKVFRSAAAVAVLCAAGIGLGNEPASASAYCAAGGSCFYVNGSYSGSSYRNTAGHYPQFSVVGFHDNITSVADSTSSTSYQGIVLYKDSFCGGSSYFLSRGGSISWSSGDSWNDTIDSFRLLKNDGTTVSC